MDQSSAALVADLPRSAFPWGETDPSVMDQVESTPHWTRESAVETVEEFIIAAERRAYAIVKRLFDIAFAATLLILSSPIWLVVAVAILATSPGPILFRQTRVGRGGRHFTCLKFRSMTVEADREKVLLMHLNETTGPVFKVRNDPRITPIGKWLRRSSIDELPQLLNVIAGTMSIVGPRPPVPEEVAKYEPHHLGRLAVKPGLTCIWQVSGRSLLHFEEWVRLDLEYIAQRTFWLDLKLVARTIPAVIRARGAH